MSYIIFSTLQEKKKHKMNNIFFIKNKTKRNQSREKENG